MKTQYFILFLFLLTAQQSAAQVTFSHTGTSNNQVNASTYIDDGERVRFEINNDSLIIYDASLQNVIAQDLIAGAPFSSGVFASIQHIARNTFDCDSTNIEYAVLLTDGPPPNHKVVVARIGGGVLFSRDSSSFLNGSSLRPYKSEGPISEINGTSYMQIYDYNRRKRDFYTLCGKLPKQCCEPCGNSGGGPTDSFDPIPLPHKGALTAYPNPSTGILMLNYELPGLFEEGILELCDLQGKVIRSIEIEEHKSNLQLDLNDFPSGKYLFILRDEAGHQVSEKLIKL